MCDSQVEGEVLVVADQSQAIRSDGDRSVSATGNAGIDNCNRCARAHDIVTVGHLQIVGVVYVADEGLAVYANGDGGVPAGSGYVKSGAVAGDGALDIGAVSHPQSLIPLVKIANHSEPVDTNRDTAVF